MNDHIPPALAEYLASPNGMLFIGHIKMGRWQMRDVGIGSRQGAIALHEMLESAWQKTTRYRPRKDGSFPNPQAPAPARLLSVEIAAHLNDKRTRRLKRNTVKATSRTLALLQIACGDVPISRITEDDIRALFDLIRWAPEDLHKKPELLALPAAEIIEQGRKLAVKQPAPATFELHRRFLTTFFNNRIKARAITLSPMDAFSEMQKDLVIDPTKPRKHFEDTELATIFDPATFVHWARKYPHRWWAPMIGLYTGMRVNEVAQLKVADFVEERGVWCIDVQATVDDDLEGTDGPRSRQSVKGKSSIRRIPIAQPLIDAGILDFLEDMREFRHNRVFPNLSAGVNKATGETNARYSQNLNVQFGKYLHGRGIRKGLRFHGFRHSISTDLSNQGFTDEDIALITGHSVAKRVPILRNHYIHTNTTAVRRTQNRLLASYQPAVQLPVYRRGQFAKALGLGARVYP